MYSPNNQYGFTDPKDFWDSLHLDILTSNQNFKQEDYLSFIERCYMFSVFFRGCHPVEKLGLQELLKIKNFGYVVVLDLTEALQGNNNDVIIDDLELHSFLKELYAENPPIIGPMITNRLSLLFSIDEMISEGDHRQQSLSLGNALLEEIQHCYHIQGHVGIGRLQNLSTIYTSFVDALSSLYFRSEQKILFYSDYNHTDTIEHFDYVLAEKHLLESIRLRKADSYDYFKLMMDAIRPMNDDTKRNKILEILILSNHAMSMDSRDETKFSNYTGYFSEFMELKGDQLIEFAYRCFVFITSYVKPQSNIDYTNHIVKATQEYLEYHYAEDISLEDVAEQVNISPQYFSKLIKKTTGFNFIDWLSMLRVKKAKELLTNSNLTVKEVCFMVGYKDPNYFSRIFKKRIGITPSEFVKTSSYFNNKS